MKTEAIVVADSLNEYNNRIITMQLTYPRIIHSEVMTHRMFSRNAASSRAVPASKLIEAVVNHPFVPIAFQKSHSGMQGTEYITDPAQIKLEQDDWLDDRDYAVKKAKARLERGVTKQLINRPLEPFQYYTTLVTATEWENFFALRCPQYNFELTDEWENFFALRCPQYNFELTDVEDITVRSRKDMYKKFPNEKATLDGLSDLDWLRRNMGAADIHMMALAEAMWDAMNESVPKQLKAGDWHIPYGDQIDYAGQEYYEAARKYIDEEHTGPDELAIRIATARCAQTSYTVVGEDGKAMNYEKLIGLHDRLLKAGHMSPFEHCARSMDSCLYELYNINKVVDKAEVLKYKSDNEDHSYSIQDYDADGNMEVKEFGWCGNFRGFIQYRKMIPGENKT